LKKKKVMPVGVLSSKTGKKKIKGKRNWLNTAEGNGKGGSEALNHYSEMRSKEKNIPRGWRHGREENSHSQIIVERKNLPPGGATNLGSGQDQRPWGC